MDKPHQRRVRYRSAFTLIEILVVIAVIALLIGITVPVVSNSRKAARRALCLSHCAQLLSLLHSYTTDHRELFPSWYPEPASPGSVGPYQTQNVYLMSDRKWSDYCGIPYRDGILHCPGNPHGRWSGGVDSSFIEYFLPSCLWIVPGDLNPSLPPSVWRKMTSGRVQQLSSVYFPSAKVGVFERYVMHGEVVDLTRPGVDVGPITYTASAERGSVALLDGHAFFPQIMPPDPQIERRPIWFGAVYETPAWGIQGRDF